MAFLAGGFELIAVKLHHRIGNWIQQPIQLNLKFSYNMDLPITYIAYLNQAEAH